MRDMTLVLQGLQMIVRHRDEINAVIDLAADGRRADAEAKFGELLGKFFADAYKLGSESMIKSLVEEYTSSYDGDDPYDNFH